MELSLSRNRLTDESNVWSVTAFLPNLQRLNLSHNNLSRVPLGLEEAPSVTATRTTTESPDAPDAFPRLQWLNLASNSIQHDEVVAALLSYAANLRQLILFDNPIAKPLLPSELKEQHFQDLKQVRSAQSGSTAAGAGASGEVPGRAAAPGSARVVNIVTDGNAATAGMAAADDATRSASISVGMLKGTRRAAAQRAAVHSAALSAAQVVEGSVRPAQRQQLLNGSAAVPQGMAALDAALGASIGAAYTALRHRRGGSLFAVTDDARRLRSAREALGGLTLHSSRKQKLHSAMHGNGRAKSKFASETQASLSRSTGAGGGRRRADGSRAAFESPAARRALIAAGKLAQLGNPPQSLVRARDALGGRGGSTRASHGSSLLPAVSSAKVTDDDLAAVAATLVPREQPAVPVRLAAALSALRHAVQQPSGDDARMAQLMAHAAASRRAAQRERK